MGPLFWRHPEHGLKKCAERTGNSCDPAETDGCCAVTACSYCLELAIYGDPSVFSEDPATFTGTGWSGSVGGHTFFGYWERNIYTDECEFIVLFDGEEVYRKSCYEGVKCRDSSDETTVTVGYDEGTLYWRRVEPLPLAHIVDPDTGCKTWYCDDCDCSCLCLCATITEPDGRIQKGELCNVAYECEPPIWEGQIGYYDLSLALDRDIYGRCIIVATVDGEEQTAVLAPGCKNLSAIIELYDGTTIEVACKICDCVFNVELTCCGPTRCLPNQECFNPLPLTLRINVSGDYSGIFGGGPCTCLELDSILTFYENDFDNPHTGVGNVWATTFSLCGVSYRYSLGCTQNGDGWVLAFLNGNGSGGNQGNCLEQASILMTKASCTPLVLSGGFGTSGIGCCGPDHLVGLATLNIVIWEE